MKFKKVILPCLLIVILLTVKTNADESKYNLEENTGNPIGEGIEVNNETEEVQVVKNDIDNSENIIYNMPTELLNNIAVLNMNENNFDEQDEMTFKNGTVVKIIEIKGDITTVKEEGYTFDVNSANLLFEVLSIPYYKAIGTQLFLFTPINALNKPVESNYDSGVIVAENTTLDNAKIFYSFDELNELTEIPSSMARSLATKVTLTNKDYFRNLSYRSATSYTAAEIDRYIAYKNTQLYGRPNSGSCYFKDSKSSLLVDDRTKSNLSSPGALLKSIESTYGVNALFLLSMANHESCFGFSGFALSRNNFVGLMAYDSSPEMAAGFNTRDEGLSSIARFISDVYSDVNWSRFGGTHIGDSPSNPNSSGVCPWDGDGEDGLEAWATGCGWQDGLSQEYANIDAYLGNKDYNKYSIAKIKSGATYYKDTKNNISYKTIARSNVEFRQVIIGETTDYYVVKPDPLIDANSNLFIAPYGIMNSKTDVNDSNYIMYKTSTRKSDIRDKTSMFYVYKRTTGSLYGEYGKVVDANNRGVYVKKSDVIALYGKDLSPSQYSNQLVGETKIATQKNGNLTVNFMASEVIEGSGIMKNINNDQFTAYLKNENGHIINQKAKASATGQLYRNYKFYNVDFDYTSIQKDTRYVFYIKTTDLKNTNKKEHATFMNISLNNKEISGSTMIYDCFNKVGAFKLKTIIADNVVIGDSRGASLIGHSLFVSVTVSKYNTTNKSKKQLNQNDFIIFLVDSKGNTINATSQVNLIGKVSNEYSTFSSIFNAFKLTPSETYTVKVIGKSGSDFAQTANNLYMSDSYKGNIKLASHIKYVTDGSRIAKMKLDKADNRRIYADTKEANVTGKNLNITIMAAELNHTNNKLTNIKNDDFIVRLVNENNHVVYANAKPVYSGKKYNQYKYYTVSFLTSSLKSGTNYKVSVRTNDVTNGDKSDYLTFQSSTYKGFVKGSNSISYNPTDKQMGQFKVK